MALEGSIQAALAALVAGRCWPLVAPINAQAPYITYQVISMNPDVTLKGPNGLQNSRVQVDCMADTYGAVKTLAQSASAALAASFPKVIPLPGHDMFDEDSKTYGYSQDFSFWHR